MHKRGSRDEVKALVIDAIRNGASLNPIAKLYGISYTTAREWILRAGLQCGPVGRHTSLTRVILKRINTSPVVIRYSKKRDEYILTDTGLIINPVLRVRPLKPGESLYVRR